MLIPKPAKLVRCQGSYTLDPHTVLVIEPDRAEIGEIGAYLQDRLRPATGFPLELARATSTEDTVAPIRLILSPALSSLGQGGYRLEVTPEAVELAAAEPAGLFAGVQTLCQLFPPEIESSRLVAGNVAWSVPCVEVEDKPRFPWRGTLLDCSRHFMSVGNPAKARLSMQP